MNKILVVEDSELLHRMYDLIFQRYRASGTSIVHAYNGRDALTQLAAHPDVDLIILDINMPVMSGLEFLTHCRAEKIFQDIPVIIVSTEGKESDTLRGLQAGARAYITKPFTPPALHRLVEKVFVADGGDRMRARIADPHSTAR
ncbi:MAG: response regulator [Thermoanaerobaculia bacterium]